MVDMKTNHTPGPWTAELISNGYYSTGVRVMGERVSGYDAVVHMRWNCPAQKAEQLANASLIAAAPELLKELEACTSWMEELREFNDKGPWDWTKDCAYTTARAAIAKAKGEQPQHNAGLPRAASWPITPVEYLAQRLREDDEDLQGLMDRDMGG